MSREVWTAAAIISVFAVALTIVLATVSAILAGSEATPRPLLLDWTDGQSALVLGIWATAAGILVFLFGFNLALRLRPPSTTTDAYLLDLMAKRFGKPVLPGDEKKDGHLYIHRPMKPSYEVDMRKGDEK